MSYRRVIYKLNRKQHTFTENKFHFVLNYHMDILADFNAYGFRMSKCTSIEQTNGSMTDIAINDNVNSLSQDVVERMDKFNTTRRNTMGSLRRNSCNKYKRHSIGPIRCIPMIPEKDEKRNSIHRLPSSQKMRVTTPTLMDIYKTTPVNDAMNRPPTPYPYHSNAQYFKFWELFTICKDEIEVFLNFTIMTTSIN